MSDSFANSARMRTSRRWLVIGALIALAAAVIVGWTSPQAVAPAYRFAIFAWFAPAMGAVLLGLIHRMTGGHWGDVLAPFLGVAQRFVPWLWLAALALLGMTHRPVAARGYDGEPAFIVRAAIYLVAFFVVRWCLNGRSFAWVGPAGMIVLVFLLHLLAEDWLGGLEPGWHSTAFPLVWMTGQAVAGLAVMILAALFCGARPDEVAPDAVGLDWGNLLLAAMLLWCYVAFAQFLIIWAGNLPREISWYQHRTEGGWALVPAILALVHFALPFTVLLSRQWKRSPIMLGGAAAVLLIAQWVFTAWLILPASPAAGLGGLLLSVVFLGFLGAVLAHRFLAGLERQLAPS